MISFSLIAQLTLLTSTVWVIRRGLYLWKAVQSVRGVPRWWCFVNPNSPVGALFPLTWWNPTIMHAWTRRDRYRLYDSDVIHFVPLLIGDCTIHTAAPELIREGYADLKNFVKDPKARSLDFMGPNVLSSIGDVWRRHRKITAPAFDGQIYIDVWSVTARLYREMMNSHTWKGDSHYFENFNPFTTRLALLVIAASGFNLKVAWEESLEREGLSNSVDSTIIIVSSTILPRLILPTWAWKLPFKAIQRIEGPFQELRKFLITEVAAKKEELSRDEYVEKEITTANRNLFARVVMASQQEGAKGLDADEIIGNLFIYLFAGHETTAHALVATLALFALHQDEQERIYQHIISVVGDREMTYDDYGPLAPVLHCFYETLRLYPSATNSIRDTTVDYTMHAPGMTPTGSIFLAKGTEIILDLVGACRNPRTYVDPDSFRPQRWTETPSIMENFLAFAVGPRLCLGRKFSTVEAVCFLSHILRDWKFDVKLEPGETLQQWEKRCMQPDIAVTLKIERIPLLVTRRTSKAV